MSFDLDAPAEIEFDLEPPVAETPEPVALPAEEPISFESETQFDGQFESVEELPVAEEVETETIDELRFDDEVAPIEEHTEELVEELTLGQADEDALDRALEPAPDDLFGSVSEALPQSLPDISLPDITEE